MTPKPTAWEPLPGQNPTPVTTATAAAPSRGPSLCLRWVSKGLIELPHLVLLLFDKILIVSFYSQGNEEKCYVLARGHAEVFDKAGTSI